MALLNTSLTMRGVWYNSPYNVSVVDLPMPSIVNETDVVVKITTSAICGSDLHFYHGYSADVPFALGHEAVGYISEIGSAVSSLSLGDYVIIPDNADAGHWNPMPHPVSFGVGSSDYGGLQAEYVRVPFADDSLIPIPINSTSDRSLESDYVMLADIFSTAWNGLTYSGFQPGDSVAVFGAGPVGLLVAYSAKLRGASRIYSIDQVQQRLDIAKSIGAHPINFLETDPVAEILSLEPNGVRRSIDAVGFEAVNTSGEMDPSSMASQMVNVTGMYGGLGIIGVYFGGLENANADAQYTASGLWGKGLSVGSGIALPLEINGPLLELVASGTASPSFIVSAEIGIEDAPEYYQRFSNHTESKVLIRFDR
ncbi:hypothetical protein PFICI_09990 [Pestalotiopsis fici W106-1]|uniref:Uncharacterized protein n=1 Tax=Pestalotiopsis fici (strain W106-1 / CGMCC3.15140) TaxID=1229662 RepID=W3WVM8_PESFW|nr:uncharacterized protein PFICI_09990 [Pestalotiopsis fici W106-1]ETS77928.1 hypothetical protein PFICI_09990 [Pestalotiopsis fici W106-1]